MIDQLLDVLEWVGRGLNAATAAIDSIGMSIALFLLTAILAAVGGFVNGRMRLYGALVGGMLVNAVVKAMGGGFATALAATVVFTAAGFVLGCTPLLLKLMKLQQRRP